MERSLAFTAEELNKVLDGWISLFNDIEWLKEVHNKAKGDVRVVSNLIEEKQCSVWRQYSIDPDEGFRDLPMAKNAFVGDPVCHKILFVSVLEESVTNQCTTGKIVGGPHSVEEFVCWSSFSHNPIATRSCEPSSPDDVSVTTEIETKSRSC
eukprot:TRINITY_DN2671_c0_g2_i1.p1 TRINITY_DN2671_c0_g2~~TRINITY_DN2671_c0_g2_i1.p1  ORF type:complete len:152 (-),score=25.26 TRINITY_DN2671_c0_g2_i1:206-661(-)